MAKILSFDEFHLKNNEGEDVFTVKEEMTINPTNHRLKLTSTDFNEFATLKDTRTGKNYLLYFDSGSPEFRGTEEEPKYVDYDEKYEEWLEPDAIGIEAFANDLPESEIGFGSDDWENPEKSLVELDEELTDDMIEEFYKWIGQGGASRRGKMNVQNELKKILSEIQLTSESWEFEFSEEILEAKGIQSAIREILIGYLKDENNLSPDKKIPSYSEAREFIKEKKPGWNLSKEDYEEAKTLL